MLKNKRKLNKFYQNMTKNEQIPYKKALVIYEALHNEAVGLGVIASRTILDGLETDLKVAKILNRLA